MSVRFFPQELRGGNPGLLLEEPGEVLRVFETQQAGGFVDVVPVHQEVLSLIYHIGMDVADGGAAGGFVDDVTQVTGRIG